MEVSKFSKFAFLTSFFILIVIISCYPVNSEPVNVFIIPHSHCDPGWLNTFEGYFQQQVNRILDSVTAVLLLDSKKRFSWAEISFFQLWYDRQTLDTREAVKQLVVNGQLEFIAGGWVQNDEANANFDIVIDQITEGHDFLHRTFGVVPRVAWQIDPFGHSSLTPSLFARMGFEAVVINRIHYELKANFKRQKTMEFIWQGSESLGNSSQIFTHVLHTHYSAPQGFDWEEHSAPISSTNVQYRAGELIGILKGRAEAYRTSNLLVTFGDDFKFQNAHNQFHNMDQLIDYINSRKDLGFNIQYGTVSQYFDAVFRESQVKKIEFPHYSGDFFPYADNADAYWTGYYTTRPYLKGHSRGTDSHLRAAETLYALGRMHAFSSNETLASSVDWHSLFSRIRQARRDVALVQHHDGITGTAKSFVANDYVFRLDRARETSSETITEMLQVVLTKDKTPELFEIRTFDFPETTGSAPPSYAIVVHNPLAWSQQRYVSIYVSSSSVTVTDASGVIISSQILPYWDAITPTPGSEPSLSKFELYFMVDVPPLGVKTYFLTKSSALHLTPLPSEYVVYESGLPPEADRVIRPNPNIKKMGQEPIFIENEHVKVRLSNRTGLLDGIFNKDINEFLEVRQEILDYTTSASGAYIFRPRSLADPFSSVPFKLHVITGVLVSQACLYMFKGPREQSQDTGVCFRVYSSRELSDPQNIMELAGYVHVAYNMGSRSNRETISRFSTNLKTDGQFYTDNGLEIRARKTKSQGVEKDFYPCLSLGYIQDKDRSVQFTIITRQASGTSSQKDGSIEHMLHRNLVQDDGRGLGEPNNDNSRIRVSTYLMFQPISSTARVARRLALSLQHYPRMMFGITDGDQKSWVAQYQSTFVPLTSSLPTNVHLLSLKARDTITDDVILRFAHIYEANQHALFSKPASIAWDRLFQNWVVESRRERSLALTMDVNAAQSRRPTFLPSNEVIQHVSGLPPGFSKQESQNTQEEGVFISQAALDEMNKNKNNDQTVNNDNNNDNTNNDNNLNNFDEDNERRGRQRNREKSPQLPPHRKLQAIESPRPVSSIDNLVLYPMEIKSFFGHLEIKKKNTKPGSQLPPIATLPPADPVVPTVPVEIEPTPIDEPSLTASSQAVEVGDVEMTSMLILSVVCTGLIILVYSQLRPRSKKNGENIKRKDFVV